MYRLIKSHECGISSLTDNNNNCYRVRTDSVNFLTDKLGKYLSDDEYKNATKATFEELLTEILKEQTAATSR